MTALERKVIRYRLIDRHRELVRGSMQDLLIARRLLHFLLAGEIRLGLDDVGRLSRSLTALVFTLTTAGGAIQPTLD